MSREELGYAYAINKRNAAPSPQTDFSPVLLLFISPLPSFENPEHGITSDNQNSQQSQIPAPSIFSVYEYQSRGVNHSRKQVKRKIIMNKR